MTEKEYGAVYEVADELFDEINDVWLKAKASRTLSEDQVQYLADYMTENVRFYS